MIPGLILIADDDQDFVDMLAARFESLGYRVLTAKDGDVALHAFDRERPGLVLLDIHMPNVDGLFVLREMREIEPEARVIVMTGLPTSKSAALMIEEGACDFLVKPFDFSTVENSVSVNMLFVDAGTI